LTIVNYMVSDGPEIGSITLRDERVDNRVEAALTPGLSINANDNIAIQDVRLAA
jgi:hypothetical protein